MGLFSSDRYSRPGPGVNPDTPRKKGMARLLEILGRDLWSFFCAGLLAFAGMLPFVLGMVLAVTSHAVLLAAGEEGPDAVVSSLFLQAASTTQAASTARMHTK